MIKPQDYSKGPPALKADVLRMDAGDVAVLTVQKVETDVQIPQPGDEPRKVLVVRFAERPDHAYYCNQTSIKRLIEGLGEEESRWIGKQVPLIATDQVNPNSGEATTSLWVADPKSWDKHLKGSRAAAAKRGSRK